MPLDTGTRIGPYEVLGAIGAGGMGEVYRARDSRLDRDVAIKILPSLFAADGDRVARFEREAKTLAALNHPNIAAIYGIETGPTSALNALVMELVEGPTLEEMVHGARAPLPVADVVVIARQIAEALEAAHEQGIVHRDLKPANVKVRPDGTVKVLDFGLAKALDPGTPGAEQMNSPTLTARATQLGIVLGTAAYMAPEQAKGKPVDRRADIWAFGVILHEMLTGHRLYGGETAPETLAHVIASDPNLAALPPSTPTALRALIVRCLVKDPKARLRDIGEARLALGDLHAADTPVLLPAASPRGSRLSWGIAAVALVAALAFAILWWRSSATVEPAPLTASLELPPNSMGAGSFAISPDGSRLVMQVYAADTGRIMFWMRDLATGASQPIKQTDGALQPFWSPDGRQIGFFAEGKLKRLDFQNGVVTVLADAPTPRGGSWGPDGRIVFAAQFRSGLQVVNATGGAAMPFTTPQKDEKSHRWPVFLPDGRHILFLAQRAEGGSRTDPSSIDVIGADGTNRRRLVSANSSPLYAEPGFVMFWKDGVLHGQVLDPLKAVIEGDPFVVATGVSYDTNELARATVSTSGRLVYMSGESSGGVSVEWINRQGVRNGTIVPRSEVDCGIALSPDAKRLAVGLTQPGSISCDQWIYDLDRGTSMRLTFEDTGEYTPLWSLDGRTLYMAVEQRNQDIVGRAADGRGKPEIVFTSERGAEPLDISQDGTWMLISAIDEKNADDLMKFDFATRKLTPIVNSPFAEWDAALSPDNRFVAYVTDRSGVEEVYVSPTSGEGGLWQVSNNGGSVPRWSPDGRELFFIAPPDRMMSVAVLPGEGFRTSAPALLFRAPFALTYNTYEVGPGGQRFAAQLSEERHLQRPLTVLSDWRALVRPGTR